MRYRILALFLLVFIGLLGLQASDLPHSRTSSYYKYIYKLSAKEAKSIYKHGLGKVEETFFHHLLDSVPNDSVFNTRLPQGNYLLAWAQKNELKFEFRSYSDLEVMVHNNYSDLFLTIANTNGKPIIDATVKIKGTTIKYNPELKAYRKHKVNKRGWLQVTNNGFTSYHYIGNPVQKGVRSRKLTSSSPIKYVYVPVKLIAFLPFDLVRTIYKGNPHGFFYYAYKPFKDTYYSIFRHRTYGWVKGITQLWQKNINTNYSGYMVYSKPKYKPNDTIRFKSFVTYSNGQPLTLQPLKVELKVGNKDIVLDTIQPNRKGSYNYQFTIHDSLRLQLDKYYAISLERMNDWDDVITKSFKYEDYELNSVKYFMRADDNSQLRGKPFYIHLKGEDMNGLNVPDGRVELNLFSNKKYSKIYSPRAYLSDTIYTYRQKLNAVGETSIQIPDSIFPAMDFEYILEAIFRTADNERIQKTKHINFYHIKKTIDLTVTNDSLHFIYKNLGVEEKTKAKITALDKNGNVIDSTRVKLPCTLPANYSATHYQVQSNDVSQQFNMSQFKPSLSISSLREHKKVHINVNNPNKIWFNYFIYKKDKEIAKGYTPELDTVLNFSNSKGCYIALNYRWGGKPYNRTYDIPFYKKQLKVEVRQPKVIYPGQTTNIEVEITDYKNRPVEGVDLTVFGLTKKFGYTASTLSYYGKETGSRTMFNNYHSEGDKLFGNQNQLPLNYSKWNSAMNLDTITYYRFSRPEKGMSVQKIPVEDKLTQFAPYVYKNGEEQTIHFIYLDYKLLYSSISTNNDPYSFKAYPGKHHLRLRTATQDIILDSVYFKHGYKTLISVDTDIANKHVASQNITPEWTVDEKSLIQRKFAKFDFKSRNEFSYLEQKGRIYMLNGSDNYQGYYHTWEPNLIVGPLNAGHLKYNKLENENIDFEFEPSYRYSLDKNRIKMRTSDCFWLFKPFSKTGIKKGFRDLVISREALVTKKKDYCHSRLQDRIQYNIAYVTNKGAGTIGIDYTKKSLKDTVQLSNMLLFKDDEPQFMQLFPAHLNRVHNLKPGSYRLFFLMNNGQYFQEKEIIVKPNTISAILAAEPDSLLKDSMSNKINELISTKWVLYSRYGIYSGKKWETENEIKATYQKSHLDYSSARMITGCITDKNGIPIPGVTVMLEGTTVGTISDMDGNYNIEVPVGEWQLQYSLIGYQSFNAALSYSDKINVQLQEEELALDEVVVVGYGTQRKEELTGSISTVKSDALTKVVGGKVAGVSIKGFSSANTVNEPLYIIDGMLASSGISNIEPDLVQHMEVLKDDAAIAIYGSRAANGVILVTTKGGKGISGITLENEIEVPIQVSGMSSLRSNFLDEAFWQPNLITGKDGKVNFTVTFPDDITSWSTYALAMGQDKTTGKFQSEIKSFKPVAAQLMTPRFLMQGDSVSVIGKMLNYTGDTITVNTNFKADSTTISHEVKEIGRIHIDSLPVVVNEADTLELTYSLNRENGYFDGERREIPVFPQGAKDVVGGFFTLNSDTTIVINLPEGMDNGKFNLESSPIKILLNETNRLRNYKHLCNEQASSKLITLLNEEKICKHLGIEFSHKREVDRLIKRLVESKSQDGLWGWWENMQTRWWITAHVLEALERAKKEGYQVKYEAEYVKYTMANRYTELSSANQLDVLKAFDAMKAQVNLPKMLKEFNDSSITRVDSMRLTLLKQKHKVPVTTGSLIKHRKETLYGNYFWGRPSWSLFYGDVCETLLMYQILKNEGGYEEWLPKMRNYFYERRTVTGWRNTYESALIVDMMLPDLLDAHKRPEGQYLKLNIDGKETMITDYPQDFNIDGSQQIIIEKQGKNAVFAGWYSRFFNPEPERKDNHFVIQSCFKRNGEKVESLVAGQKVNLMVDINVKKKSKFVMLEIPIPSVCSYHNKPQSWFRNQHREYHKEKVSIYYEYLPVGKLQLQIELVPRYTGRVVLNPARMEHMYFPVFSGNNEVKKVNVEGEKQ